MWLSFGLREPGVAPGSGEAQERYAPLEAALPSDSTTTGKSIGGFEMGRTVTKPSSAAVAARVVIGMDPHKRSVTVEVMAADEAVLDGGR